MDFKSFLRHDLPSSLVVFLVALPLCLGIALASGAPLFSGIVAGVAGGVVAGSLSGSPLSVSGPAAGLTTIVLFGISSVGSFEVFLSSVVLAGVIQIGLGFVRAGSIGSFFPSSVVKGMLAAIGLILILKQIPHGLGVDLDFEGDEMFQQADGLNTFSEIIRAANAVQPGALTICAVSLLILVLWERPFFKRWPIPAPLVVVIAGVGLNELFTAHLPYLAVAGKHLVAIPFLSKAEYSRLLSLPDFSHWADPIVYKTAVTLALVASLETLLSIEAADKLDPLRRMTPLNRELKSQGVANIVSGLLGGLPVTSVIVRTSANINAGARSKASAIMHGIILLATVLLIPGFLKMIPLASLAALLFYVGYKLMSPSLFREMYRRGKAQFAPFLITMAVVPFTDLLTGVFCGILVAVFFILKTNFRRAAILVEQDGHYLLKFTKDVSFLNKSTVRGLFEKIPRGARIVIDGSDARLIDSDIRDTITDFIESGKLKDIAVDLKNISLTFKPIPDGTYQAIAVTK